MKRGRGIWVIVVVLVVYALLRWIDQLSGLGRVAETTARVERAATHALCQRMDQPYLGGCPLEVDPRGLPGARPLYADKFGFVQHIDMPALGGLTGSQSPGQPLAGTAIAHGAFQFAPDRRGSRS